MKKLNLGAGNAVMADAVNHDLTRHRPEIAVAWDLNQLPWPWLDATFDLIVARSVFEHLQITALQALDECWRILRRGGELFLKVPYWDSEIAHQDPTHRWYFTVHSFDVVDPRTKRGREYPFYTTRKWKVVEPFVLNSAQSSLLGKLQVVKK